MEQARTYVISWLPLILSILNWLLVRYSKPDTKVPINIPARVRPWVPIIISVIAATIQKFALGSTINEALKLALIAGLSPIFAHQLVTESIMDGKEIPVPFMTKSSKVVVKSSSSMMTMIVFVVSATIGCSWFQRTPEHAGDLGRILVCIDEKLDLGLSPTEVAVACGIENIDAILDLVKARKARAAAKSSASAKPSTSAVPSTSVSK